MLATGKISRLGQYTIEFGPVLLGATAFDLRKSSLPRAVGYEDMYEDEDMYEYEDMYE